GDQLTSFHSVLRACRSTRSEHALYIVAFRHRGKFGGLVQVGGTMGKRGCPGQTAGNLTSAALFASCHDGSVQAVTKIFGHLINFVAAIDLDRFLSGVEDDFAVAAFLQVQLNFSAGLGGNRVVDQIV